MHSVHTLDPDCAHGARSALRPRVHAARAGSCRGRASAMSQPCGRPCRGLGGRIVALCRAHIWPCRGLYRNTAPCLMLPPGHDTLPCIAIQFPHRPTLPLSRYNGCIVTHSPAIKHPPITIHLLYRDTLPSQSSLRSRYNSLYHDTVPPSQTIVYHDTI